MNKLIRIVTLWTFALPLALAQDKPPDTETLSQASEKSFSEWEALSKGLNQKIAKLLPCDPQLRAAIDQVSKASETRLAALSAYLKAEVAQAKDDTDLAKQLLATIAPLAGAWNTEHAEADQERAAIDAQVTEMLESKRKRPSLEPA